MDESGSAPWVREALIASSRRTADWRARLACGALLLSGPDLVCSSPLWARSAKTEQIGSECYGDNSGASDGTCDQWCTFDGIN
jgi:hypothetical protein